MTFSAHAKCDKRCRKCKKAPFDGRDNRGRDADNNTAVRARYARSAKSEKKRASVIICSIKQKATSVGNRWGRLRPLIFNVGCSLGEHSGGKSHELT